MRGESYSHTKSLVVTVGSTER